MRFLSLILILACSMNRLQTADGPMAVEGGGITVCEDLEGRRLAIAVVSSRETCGPPLGEPVGCEVIQSLLDMASGEGCSTTARLSNSNRSVVTAVLADVPESGNLTGMAATSVTLTPCTDQATEEEALGETVSDGARVTRDDGDSVVLEFDSELLSGEAMFEVCP